MECLLESNYTAWIFFPTNLVQYILILANLNSFVLIAVTYIYLYVYLHKSLLLFEVDILY